MCQILDLVILNIGCYTEMKRRCNANGRKRSRRSETVSFVKLDCHVIPSAIEDRLYGTRRRRFFFGSTPKALRCAALNSILDMTTVVEGIEREVRSHDDPTPIPFGLGNGQGNFWAPSKRYSIVRYTKREEAVEVRRRMRYGLMFT